MAGRSMLREVFITTAVTGAGETTQKHPGVPVTPEQIANAAIASAKAGAAVAHCHVRDPKTGKGSRDVSLYREVVQRIRAADVDVVINLTAGMGCDVEFGPGEDPTKLDMSITDCVGPMSRLPHIEELLPEICTLDCGSMNFGEGEFIIMNTPGMLRTMAKRIKELGVKPECEVFDTGHLWFVNQLYKDGLLADPPMIQLCCGIPYGAPADIGTAKAMVDRLPANAIFSGFAISRDQMPFVAGMPLIGGNVRVGLEDNLYLERGVLASNEQLTARAKEILTRMGCKVLGPEDVRKKLGLVKRPCKISPNLWLKPSDPQQSEGPPAKKQRSAPKQVALIGGGVIGAGWAARFAINGFDVTVVDPDPEAERKIQAVVANAKRAYNKLTLAPLGGQGKITVTTDLAMACANADFIQENLPENEGLKRDILAKVDKSARPDVVIGSSTSGILPSKLQADMAHPERLVVAHPFNPVYLIPLVEVCGGCKTTEETKKRAVAMYSSIGMHPLVLHKECPGHISDRLLEALWREALHLVNDGVATTDQIDQSICYGPGLRWAFMGTFLTYRLAGGEAGMRHFMAQFGPCLKEPWTKLIAPELTEELINRVVQQSDNQANGISIRDLEKRRDDCLVAVMQGLRDQNFASGAVLKNYEEKLYAEQAHTAEMTDTDDLTQPLRLHRTCVSSEWVDYNGHMTESRYLQVFGDGSDALFRYIGVDSSYLAKGFSYYTVESHIMHKKEVAGGEPLAIATVLLSSDEKRIHLFHTLEHGRDGTVLATAEQMMLHVNTKEGRTCPSDPAIVARLQRIVAGQKGLPRPKDAGRFVGAPK